MMFILAMLRHPEVFTKAQNEVDNVIGNDRLPDFGDKESLPYLNALISELYRLVGLMPCYFQSIRVLTGDVIFNMSQLPSSSSTRYVIPYSESIVRRHK